MIDLSPAQLKTVESILAAHVPECEVRAFGSRVTWTAKDYSDLDLAIVGARVLDSDTLRKLRESFEESDLPFRVDLLDWHGISESFRKVIEKKYAVVQKSGKNLGVAGEWRELPFSEAVLLNPATPIERGIVYPFVDMQAITAGTRDVKCSEHREFKGGGSRFQHRDTLMARITPCLENGKIARFQAVEGEIIGHGSTEFIIIRGRPNVTDNDYAYYLAISPDVRAFAISQMTGSSGRQRVPTNALGGMSVTIPPLPVQRTIARILGALDDKIELNRRMNATLEAMARALFKSWFVDFDPVRAKLDGRKPAGLDDATAAIFPDKFQDSPLGEIPKGWRVGTLGDLVQLRTDRVDATPAKDNMRYIALEDMPSKSIDLSRFQLGSAVNSSITAFRKGDVLFGSMRPYFHKVGLVFFDGITRTTTFVLRPRKDRFRHFALLHFFSDDVVAHSTTASVGTTIPYVKWDSMESYRIPIPTDSLLEAFENVVSPLVQRIAAQGEQSRTLAALRDALLPKLLSGEIRLPDARIAVAQSNAKASKGLSV